LIKKALAIVAAAGAILAAAGVFVVALAFTLYALMRNVVGPAGASATVAGAAFLLIAIVALIAMAKAGAFRKEPTLGEKAAAFVRDKPVTAAAAALAAGIFAVRNPKALMGVVLAFLEPKGGRRS
jgi:hypothetical protein